MPYPDDTQQHHVDEAAQPSEDACVLCERLDCDCWPMTCPCCNGEGNHYRRVGLADYRETHRCSLCECGVAYVSLSRADVLDCGGQEVLDCVYGSSRVSRLGDLE